MVSLFQQFEFAYPDGDLFYDRSGALSRRLRDLFPGLEAKAAESNQRDFFAPAQELQMLFGIVLARFQSSALVDKDFPMKSASFMEAITDTLEIAQLSRFSFRHVLGKPCSTDAEVQELMWPLVGEDQKAKLATLSPLPNWNLIQGEFTHGDFACEYRVQIMHLVPHSQLKIGASVEEKMRRIIFPQIQFSGASVEEAIEYLRVRSRDLDTTEQVASKRGVEVVLKPDVSLSSAQLSLDLHDVPMFNALRYVVELAGLKFKLGTNSVLVVPLSEPDTLPHITVHLQVTGQSPINVADFDVAAFIENIRGKHSNEILSKLAPHLSQS